MRFNVLHHDPHLLVINKPTGLLSQADATGDPDAVGEGKRWLEEQGATDPFLGLVHRLDRPASGVLLLARTPDAARACTRQFRERTAQKEYLALVEGSCTGIGRWEDFIAKLGREPQIVAPDHPDGKEAVATWQAVASDAGRTLLRVQLETGRPHQIRLQAAERGHPVLGDLRHGGTVEIDGRTLALHHRRLRLEHPDTHRMETFTAPVPEAWEPVLTDQLRAAIKRASRGGGTADGG